MGKGMHDIEAHAAAAEISQIFITPPEANYPTKFQGYKGLLSTDLRTDHVRATPRSANVYSLTGEMRGFTTKIRAAAGSNVCIREAKLRYETSAERINAGN